MILEKKVQNNTIQTKLNKIYKEHLEDVRPCIRCNEFCIGHVFSEKTVTCAVNATAGNDFEYQVRPADEKKNIVVIGGGVGGMEAARVAALRGHNVTIYEKDSCLGGTTKIIATADFKKKIRELVTWFEVQLDKLGVEIVLNKKIDENSPELDKANNIIVAIGGHSVRPNIPGIDNEKVVDVIDYHKNPELVKGSKIVVCGGGLSGCDSALELAQEGREVTVVEMRKDIAMDANFYTSMCLKDMYREYGTKVMTNCIVTEFVPEGVKCKDKEGNEILLEADSIIGAFGMTSNSKLAEAIQNKYYDVRVIGDAAKAVVLVML